jgi:hypothetical protein
MADQRPNGWNTFLSGMGQALPAAIIGGIGLLATMLVNVQIQLAELRKDQQQVVVLMNESRSDVSKIETKMLDLDRRVTILEAQPPEQQ